MTTQHTSGPWKYDVAGHGNIRPVKETGQNIAYFPRTGGQKEWETQQANARLIAAAPELLEACEAALSAMPEYAACFDAANGAKTERPTILESMLSQAIRKAKGQ